MEQLEARKSLEKEKAKIIFILVAITLTLPTLYRLTTGAGFTYVLSLCIFTYFLLGFRLHKINIKLNKNVHV